MIMSGESLFPLYRTITTNKLAHQGIGMAPAFQQAIQQQQFGQFPVGGVTGPGLFATQMQGASLIPTNPVAGDRVEIYFDGTKWVKCLSGWSPINKVQSAEAPPFTLDEINQAEDEIADARRAA